ncbi:MAG: DUF6702 family protein [Bacteroidota bacterium]|jgi:hypothetical protein
MKKFLFYLGSVCVLALLFALTHKYYHSHCALELNKKSGNAEAIIEVFWHDLEVSVNKFSETKTSVKAIEFKDHLTKYLNAHFIFRDSLKNSIGIHLVGTEILNEEMNIYLEISGIKNWKGISLENKLMTGEFTEQVNQVNVKSEKGKKSLVFTSKNTSQNLY